MPSNRDRRDPTHAVLTVDYQPPPNQTSVPRLAVLARSGLAATSELAALLRRRLLFLSLVFAVLFGLVTLMILSKFSFGTTGPSVPYSFVAVVLATFVAVVLLAAILWRRTAWTLAQLRVIELLLVGTVVVNYLFRAFQILWSTEALPHTVALIGEGQDQLAIDLVGSLNHYVYMPWALLIIAYAIFIPNRWQRCALVVGVMVITPISLRTAAYVMSGLPLNDWASVAGINGGLTLLLAAAIAIYGAHRIEVLREEALKARRLGQYQLIERLGAGGMGEVYLAEHLLLRRPCAIKLIRPDRASDEQHLRRFEREVKATATLTHPNTVQVYDYGHAEDGTFYYVMEYLPGLTLEQLVERHGPLPANRAIHFLRQVCGALREAHAIRLIHRDIKPGNVIVCERGGRHDTVKLLDFGLVIPLGGSEESEKLTQEGAITGTPAYMSPEQAGGQDEIDARSDIYSVGASAYFLLTGQPPFAGRSRLKILAAHLYERPASMTSHRWEVPPELEAVIVKCLAKNPADRFPDAQSLEAAFAGCDTVGQWTERNALEWWQSQNELEASNGSTEPHDEAGRTQLSSTAPQVK